MENLDLKTQLDSSTPLVIGVILALGFLLLLVALQAPLIALLGTLASLLSTAAAFGVARLVFQDGWGSSVMGFEHQGFLDAWAPVFFFAMIFAIAMDYTVFLLASAKEHYEHSGDPKDAMVGSLAHSGRVIFAAGAVMVAVFFTFALSGPLPPKEMGIVLGVAVLLDAFLVRLVLLPVLLRLTGRAAWYAAPLADPGPARHPLLPQLTRRARRPDTRNHPNGDPPCAEPSAARPAARPPGPAAASTSTRSWPAYPAPTAAPGTPSPRRRTRAPSAGSSAAADDREDRWTKARQPGPPARSTRAAHGGPECRRRFRTRW